MFEALIKFLTRIFHPDCTEEAAKPDEARQASILSQSSMTGTYHLSHHASLTPHSSAIPASAVARHGIPCFIRMLLLLVLFILLFTAGINTYLALSGIKEEIVLKAQETLGKKLYVGLVYFLPWSGLHIESITMTNPIDPLIVRDSSISFGT
jgi:hypothetical protein